MRPRRPARPPPPARAPVASSSSSPTAATVASSASSTIASASAPRAPAPSSPPPRAATASSTTIAHLARARFRFCQRASRALFWGHFQCLITPLAEPLVGPAHRRAQDLSDGAQVRKAGGRGGGGAARPAERRTRRCTRAWGGAAGRERGSHLSTAVRSSSLPPRGRRRLHDRLAETFSRQQSHSSLAMLPSIHCFGPVWTV